MATYNGERYLAAQIRSIVDQIGPSDELLVSDDGSTDKTLEIVHSFADQRIKILENSSHRPIPAKRLSHRWKALRLSRNFENALSHASGDLVFIADQDDIWEDNKVPVSRSLLADYDLISSDCSVIDSDGKIVQPSIRNIEPCKKGFWSVLHKNPYIGCCMCFRKDVLSIALPFPELVPMYDIWIGLIGERFFRTHLASQTLVRHRRHNTNASNMTKGSPYSFAHRLFFRVYLLQQITMRKYIQSSLPQEPKQA